MLRTSQCSVKKSSGLPLSFLYTRTSYRLYPRLLHSSQKSSESDALGSAAVAEDSEEPSYAASDSFRSFRKPDSLSKRKPETRWSVPPSNAHGSADNDMRNGPPSKWSNGGTLDSGGSTPGSAPIRRYVENRQSPYGPHPRWGNTGRGAPGGDLDSKFGSRSTKWSVRPAPKPAAAEGGAHDTQPPPSGPTRSWDSSRTEPGVLGHRNPNTSSGPHAPRLKWNDPPPQPSFEAKEEYQRVEQARDIPPFRISRGDRTTDGRGVHPTPKPAAAEGGAHVTQPPPSGLTRSWDSSGTEPGVLGHRNPNTLSGPHAPRTRWNDPSPQLPFEAKEEYQRGEQARNIPPFRISRGDRTTDGRGIHPTPKPAAAEGGAHDTQPLPSGPTRSWDSSGTELGVLGDRNPNTSSGPHVPRPRWNDPPPQLSFEAKEEYQRGEQARNIPPFRISRYSLTTDGRRSEVSNRFPSGGAQSSSPELTKQGSINHTREFEQVDPKSNIAVGKGNQPESPSVKTAHSGLGKSIATDRESQIYSTDAPKTPDDTRTFEDRSPEVLGGTEHSSPTHKMNHVIKEVSATYVPNEDGLSGLAKTKEGGTGQRNAQEEKAEKAEFIASDHAAEGLRTRPLTPAELEYERRQLAKARERSRRREFDTRESAILEEGQGPLTGKAAKKAKKAKKREKQVEAAPAMIPLYLPEYISVANLARAVKMRLDDFIVQMQNMGFEDVSYDHVMNAEVAGLIAMEYGYEPIADTSKEEDLFPRPPPEDKSVLQPRPPIVTIMGHVDHGKTTLLDWLRKSSIVATEHGGITQHIGAFSVTMPSGKVITFLDTPGHSAFLSMRERGANVTDIVILVVAADDSVKPQTIEAIKHAKAANVPIIVAVNKIDKEGSDIDGVKQDLAKNGVDIEDFGGDTQVVLVSGKTGQGMEELEEATVTLSEVLDMRAETDGPCEGWVLEAGTEKRGRVATVLVNRGTLRPGDIIVAGRTWARVRSLINEHGVGVEFAAPGTPVTVDGWRDQPLAGDSVIQAASEDKAKTVINFRMEKAERLRQAADMEAVNNQRRAQREKEAAEKEIRERALADNKDPDAAVAASEKLAAESRKKYEVVNFIVKGDVAGSVEAVVEAVSPLGNEEVGAKVIRSSFGAVTEFDIDHAAAAEGYVLCFNLSVEPEIIQYARNKGVSIMTHNVIYRLVDEVSSKLSERLAPLIKYSVKAEAEILQVFSINVRQRKTMPVAGSQVKNGNLYKHDKVRVLRDGEIIYDGEFESMKIFTKEATEVKKGSECGLGFKGWGNFQAGDMIQTYEILEEARTI